MSDINKQRIKDILSYVIIIVVVILIRVINFDPVRVDGPSMDTTLSQGQIIVLDKVKYRKNDIKRFDIIVFKLNNKKLIKRVIGLPNERVDIKDNTIYINGKKIKENYGSTKTDDYDFEEKMGMEKLPGNGYFVLGDNRAVSADSRYEEVGFVRKEQILGKASIIIWPFTKIVKVK